MKPYYYSLSEYLKETYGCKMYKLSLSGGMTCPNRDGRIDTRGCIFCSAGGSGDFSGEALIGNSASLLAGGIVTPQHTKFQALLHRLKPKKHLSAVNITAVSISLIFSHTPIRMHRPII